MRKALVVLCLLLVSVTASAQTFGEFLQFVIAELYCTASDAWVLYKVSSACDYDNPITRSFAMDNARAGVYSIAQVCDIFDAVMKPHWTYYSDPHRTRFGDFITPASASITNKLRGDCDDFSVLVAACIRAIGGACRIALMRDDDMGGHAMAEVYIGTPEQARIVAQYIGKRYGARHVFFDTDGAGEFWLSLDWGGTAPTWYDAHPGRTPSFQPGKVDEILYAPVFSLVAWGQGIHPVPIVP